MNLSIWLVLALVPPLLLLEGLFAGSEIALFSADKLALKRMARNGHQGAKLAIELSAHPERILSTTLVMTSLCAILTSALISLYFLGTDAPHGSWLAVLITSPLVVLFGELMPKSVYRQNATRFAPWVAFPVYWTFWILYPLTRVLSAYTSRLSRLVVPLEELLTGKRRTTREELQSLMSYGRGESEIKSTEKKMIKRIFDFKDTEAKHALIPLVQVEAVEDTVTVHEALEKFERHRHSRMPVYSDRIDNIVGVLEAADLIGASDLKQPIQYYITPAHYVAETQFLDDVLLDMRGEDSDLVVVVDEHGGAVGVLTFEDVIEEIVGEIADEHDTTSSAYKTLADHSWLVQARMEIEEINERLKLELPRGEYETLSGFLLQQFGRIPETRDELFFNTPAGSFKFTIRKATERHIEAVLIERIGTRAVAPE